MGIIRQMESYMKKKDDKLRREEEKKQYIASKMQKEFLRLINELNGILAGIPRISGMQAVSDDSGLYPEKWAIEGNICRVVFFVRWAKSIDGIFGQRKLADIYKKLVEHIGLSRMKVCSNISCSNEQVMKSKYFFLLRGMEVLEIDEDEFNIYICIAVNRR